MSRDEIFFCDSKDEKRLFFEHMAQLMDWFDFYFQNYDTIMETPHSEDSFLGKFAKAVNDNYRMENK